MPILLDAFDTFKNKTPVPFVSSRTGQAGLLDRLKGSDRVGQLQAMGASGTLFAIVGSLSNDTSRVNWRLYRKRRDGRRTYGPATDTRVEVLDHLALRIWNKPNPFMTQQEFVETFEQHIELTGEAWWLVSKIEGTSIPMELWPVRPDKMQVVPSATDFLSGYVYSGPDGEKVPLDLDEVVQIRTPNPEDPYRGMGPVQTILADLQANDFAAAYNRNFFINSAAPGGIIEVPEELSDREFQTLSTRWREQHQGVANAHRVAILEKGKWVERNSTMKDMQFVELRGVSREVIREAFRYPKPMLGAVDDVNRANAEAGEYVYSKYMIEPRLERIKQALNSDFLPLFGSAGEGVEFDYDCIVPENMDQIAAERISKAQAAQTLITAGFSPEEVLQVVGLPPMTYVGGGNGPQGTPNDNQAA